MTRGETAEAYFRQGYNCSQAVAMAFADDMGMEKSTVARLTVGFGGGMGRMREVCGTVSGMSFVLSVLYGDSQKNDVYKMVQDVAGKFKAENGSIVCRELLGLDKKEKISPQSEERTPQFYKKRPCAELVHQMADFLDEYISEIGQS